MPGPKMGPRPPDFDEALVRQVNTYVLSYFVLSFILMFTLLLTIFFFFF
jgi:hypothetical protein